MDKLAAYCKTLAVGAFGGAVFYLLHIPLAWMLGAMFAVLIWHVFLKQTPAYHVQWRNGALLVIGYMIGTAFTVEAARKLVTQLPTMLLINVILIIFCLMMGYFGARFTGMSIPSGVIGNVPGGLSQMVALSEEVEHADMTVVTMMQTLRIMAVIFIVPMLVVHGIGSTANSAASADPALTESAVPFIWMPLQDWGMLLIGFLLCFIAAKLAGILRFPTPYMLGPVLMIAVLSGFGMPYAPLPSLLTVLAQLFIGCYIGASMKIDRSAHWHKLIPFALSAAVIVVVFSFGIGYLLIWMHPELSLTTAFLSAAPGGMAEMGLTAAEVNADLSVVSSYQLFRILFILFLVPPLLRWVFRSNRGDPMNQKPKASSQA